MLTRQQAVCDCCNAGTLLDLKYCRHPNGRITLEPIHEEPENMGLAAGTRDNDQYPRAGTLSSRAPPRSLSGPLSTLS